MNSRDPRLLSCVGWVNCCAKQKIVWGFSCVKYSLLFILSWDPFLDLSNLFICANSEEKAAFIVDTAALHSGR